MFKMDWNGQGQEIMLDDLNLTIFRDLSFEQFASTCVMAGCDFLPNIPNVGIKKALKQIQICGGDYEKVRWQMGREAVGNGLIRHANPPVTLLTGMPVFPNQRLRSASPIRTSFSPHLAAVPASEGVGSSDQGAGAPQAVGSERSRRGQP